MCTACIVQMLLMPMTALLQVIALILFSSLFLRSSYNKNLPISELKISFDIVCISSHTYRLSVGFIDFGCIYYIIKNKSVRKASSDTSKTSIPHCAKYLLALYSSLFKCVSIIKVYVLSKLLGVNNE